MVLDMAVMREAIRLLADREVMVAGVHGAVRRKGALRHMVPRLMVRVGRRCVNGEKKKSRCTTSHGLAFEKGSGVMKLRRSSSNSSKLAIEESLKANKVS